MLTRSMKYLCSPTELISFSVHTNKLFFFFKFGTILDKPKGLRKPKHRATEPNNRKESGTKFTQKQSMQEKQGDKNIYRSKT